MCINEFFTGPMGLVAIDCALHGDILAENFLSVGPAKKFKQPSNAKISSPSYRRVSFINFKCFFYFNNATRCASSSKRHHCRSVAVKQAVFKW